MRADADQTHKHGKWSFSLIAFSPFLVCFSCTLSRTFTSKIMRNNPKGILLHKTQSMFAFSLVEFVLSGCRGGVERVRGGRQACCRDARGVVRFRSMWAKPSLTPRCYQVTTAAMPRLPGDTQTRSWGRHQGTDCEPQSEGEGYRGFSPACQVCASKTKCVGE